MKEYYIATKSHESIWPGGVILFWAPKSNGYSTFLEAAGRYSEDEAKKIVSHPRSTDFMIPCESVEAVAVRVVDIDKFRELTGSPDR